MDYQSNNQSGEPQNTGEPYNNTNNGTNPDNSIPLNNGSPYDNAPADTGSPYGNAPDTGSPYGNTQNADNSCHNASNGQPPYGNTPHTGNYYGNHASGNGAPYHNTQGAGNPYGNNQYGNNPYTNTNPYNTPYNNGNPYHNPYGNGYPYGNVNAAIVNPVRNKGEGMATAAMVLGIISLISLVLLRIYIPFLLGGVGIILAVLSKGSAKKMAGKAMAGLICCITGLVLDIAICIFSVYLVFALPDIMPEMVNEVNQMCEDRYGITYDEMLDELYEMWGIE